MTSRKKLLLIGWDSADWKIIQPLMDAGHMPALKHLVSRGASGNITTLEPQLSPMLWTSIATGKHAYHHGIPGFTVVNQAGQVVPVSGATRQCKAVWDMLAEHGLKSHVVSWFATQGEKPNGTLVSHLYNNWKHTETQDAKDWPPPPAGTYWPEELAEQLNELRVSPYDIDPDEIIRLFIPEAPSIDQSKDKRIWMLTQRLSEAFTVHSATCWLMENRPDWDFTAVYYRAIDEICHTFMNYHPPQMEGIKDEDFHFYQHVVNAAYRLHDLFLGKLMQLAGSESAIVLVSDHGFHSDHLRPRFTPRVPAGITIWHRPQGIITASGPGFARNTTLYGARLLDVTPTLLAYFGLPIGEDMEGRALTDAFEVAPEISSIPSWEKTSHSRNFATVLDGDDQQALLDQFVELGYINPVSENSSQAAIETNRENDWNMSRALMDGGRYEQALPILETIYMLAPERADYAQYLAICQMRIGLFKEARTTMEQCVTRLGADNNAIHSILANIALEKGDAAAAFSHLEKAEVNANQKSLQYFSLLSRTQLDLRLWKNCIATCHKILELDPNNALAYLAMARCALHDDQPETAAEYALNSINLQYGSTQAHFLLGCALYQLEDFSAAQAAFSNVVKLFPRHGIAHRYLAQIHQIRGQHDASTQELQLSRISRMMNEKELAEKLAKLREETAERSAATDRIITKRKVETEAIRLAKEASGLPKDQTFFIVSGLPRSGTSLMMQMLQAGGLSPMTDKIRSADDDNPLGYLEWEEIKKIPQNPMLIEQAHGKVTKVIAPLLHHLPSKHKYKIIFMTRPVEEIVTSQLKMLQNRGSAPKTTIPHLEKLQTEQSSKILETLRASDRVDLLEISYPALVLDPQEWLGKICAFSGEEALPHPEKMLESIKPELHRNHSTR
jgi:predicted AlkP superfamily phosphohydrolase/phosphomutase/Tfp pilus assembly protein PilF